MVLPTFGRNSVTMRSLFLFLLFPCFVFSQFTYEDTLRGSITPERAWWDVFHYSLEIEVNPAEKYISGSNTILFVSVSGGHNVLQIDLQPPMKIDSVFYEKLITESGKNSYVYESVLFEKVAESHYYITLPQLFAANDKTQIVIYFSGKPIEAKNPPWDGGVVWKKDKNGNDFIATACQGIGASTWFPCKDHPSDEPDYGAVIAVTTPEHLMNVSNGTIRENTIKNGKRRTEWLVEHPINNYGINFNIGNYVSWDSVYHGKKGGDLLMSFYVLQENLEKSKKQFKDAFRVMEAFEYWFGPYPFYIDGYKLVEVPYLGMEHQSSVTYGNNFQNGYLGEDLSSTGWGLKWDFIIVHESGHEWFANNITCKDNADLWIHESFTTYSEGLFTEYFYGKDAGAEYIRGLRKNSLNDRAIIGVYGVNQEGSYDMYFKGANMLHTIRQIVNDDKQWLALLRGLNKDFYHQIVTTEQIEYYISDFLKIDLSRIFDQYLRTTQIPKIQFMNVGKEVKYRWINCVENFNMPLDVFVSKRKRIRIYPTTEFKKIKLKKLVVDVNYYILQDVEQSRDGR
jgi:aminopeptidase N